MALSIEQRLDLYRLARDRWIEAHEILSAYERDYRKNKLVGEWMRRGTIASAVATALSTAAPWPPLTIAAAFCTAALSSAEQVYSPAKSSQSFWECRTQLEGIKKDLVTCVMAIETATDLSSGIEPFNQIAKRLIDVTKVPYDMLHSDRDSAEREFNGSVISEIINRYALQPEEDKDGPITLGFDAQNIVVVSRQSTSST